MKRLGRWSFNGAAIISFVLFAAVAGLMIRGLFVPEDFSSSLYDWKSLRTVYTSYVLSDGRFLFAHGVVDWPPPYATAAAARIQSLKAQGVPTLPATNSLPGRKWIWFVHIYGMDVSGALRNDNAVAIHGVLILLVASLLPAVWVRRFVSRRRFAVGCCLNVVMTCAQRQTDVRNAGQSHRRKKSLPRRESRLSSGGPREQGVESGLGKMAIARERIRQALTLHRHERRAIGQAPGLIGSSTEQIGRGLK
jgi:hypothetical protein